MIERTRVAGVGKASSTTHEFFSKALRQTTCCFPIYSPMGSMEDIHVVSLNILAGSMLCIMASW